MTAVPFHVTVTMSVAETGGDTLKVPFTLEGNEFIKCNVDIPIGAAGTDKHLSVDFSADDVTFIGMAATGGDIVVKTNDAQSPADQFTLRKSKPWNWFPNAAAPYPFPNAAQLRVTGFYLTNPSGLVVPTFHLRVLRNA